jgi:hypothetical protein
MMRAALLALYVIAGLIQAAHAAEQSVQLSSDPTSSAMRAAVDVLRATHRGENIRLSTVQAAFVRLVDGGTPQLIVELGGNYCGSLGCSITLYERGTNGWVTLNEWLASSIGVATERTGLWHNIILDHERTWIWRGSHYDVAGR